MGLRLGKLASASHPCLGARVAFRCLAAVLALALGAGFFGIPLSADPAFCDEAAQADGARLGGIELVGTQIGNKKNLSGEVHPYANPSFPYISLGFNKNVSYVREGDDPSFVEENAKKVSLRRADGEPVGVEWRVGTSNTFDARYFLEIMVDGWLDPLTDYEVVVEPGIVAANGIDVSDREYVIPFRTSEECADGLSVYEKAGIVLLTAAVVAGVAAGVVRMRREKRL